MGGIFISIWGFDMNITAGDINEAAKLIGSLIFFGGLLIAAYKFYAASKAQSEQIAQIKEEQTVCCYGILACLRGLHEQGCDGPVDAALDKLEKHLNMAAHDQNEGR